MKKVKENKKGYSFFALLYLIAGMILIACPEITTKTITYSVGVILVVIGLVQIFSYLRMEPNLASGSTGFVTGVLTTFMGIFIFVKSEMFVSLVTIILGFLIIVSGTLKLQHAINIHRIHMNGTKLILLIGLINILLGIVIVFNPFNTVIVLMRIIGIALIISGITDLFSCLFVAKQFKKYAKHIEEKCIEEK